MENKPENTDFLAERQEDGSTAYTIRVKRPQVAEIWQKARGGKAQILKEKKEWKNEIGDEYHDTAAVVGGKYDYQTMMGEVGSPESIGMEDNPPLSVAFVRHLPHEGNVVSPENLDNFKPKAKALVDGLKIGPDDEVYVVASQSGQFGFSGQEGVSGEVVDSQVEKKSRTRDTAGVIKQVLKDRKIKFLEEISPRYGDESGEESGPIDSALFKALQEFEVTDEKRAGQAGKEGIANMKAKRAGEPLPFPESPAVPPVVYASHAPDVVDLAKKTAIAEMSSATVARTLKGFDALEDYFLKGKGKSGKRKVVILAGHGQFATDITEAFQNTTDGKFPVILAGNGDYFYLNAGLDDHDGKIVEEFLFTAKPKS